MAGAVKKVQIVASGGTIKVRIVPPGTAGRVMAVELVASGGIERIERANAVEPYAVQ